MRFAFADTHAYPGCRVRIEPADPETIAEFSDGAVAAVTWRHDGGTITVTVAPYRTVRGTRIGEKTWILEKPPERDSCESDVWIVRRAPHGRPAR